MNNYYTAYLGITNLGSIGLGLFGELSRVMVLPPVLNFGQAETSLVDIGDFKLFVLADTYKRLSSLEAKPGNGSFVNPITLSLTGPIVGSVSFDGTGNVSMATTVTDGSLKFASVAGLSTALSGFQNDFSNLQTDLATAEGNITTLQSNKLDATAAATSANRWTTPRTLTVTGDFTGNVTLDGSVDVTLAATAAASITRNQHVLTSSDTYNSLLTSGFYRDTNQAGSGVPGAGYGQLLVIGGGSDTAAQMYFEYEGSNFFIRGGNPAATSGVWNPWRKLWHDGNQGAGSGLDADLLDGQHGSHYAVDAAVLHLSGKEAVIGQKTFIAPVTFGVDNIDGYWGDGVALAGTASSSTAGSLVIKTSLVAATSNTMFRFTVEGFNYDTNGSWRYELGGFFNGSTSSVLNYTYQRTGSLVLSVRSAITPDGYWCIILGDDATVWPYSKARVNAMLGYTSMVDASALAGITATTVAVTTGYTATAPAVQKQSLSFTQVLDKPTTLSGYGITDGLLASAYNANDVLAKLKLVDGAGSGLDADLLDGRDSLYFAIATHTHTVLHNGLTLEGDLLPDGDNTRSLGSPTLMWKDVYVGPGSLYINGQKVLQDTGTGTILFAADPGQNISIQSRGGGDVELAPIGGGVIQLRATVMFTAGVLIRSSDGSPLIFDDPISFSAGTGITGGLSVDGSPVWTSANLNPSTFLLTVAYTAADVLAKIKTVDGSGSGLDADLLDGYVGSHYATAASLSNYVATTALGVANGVATLDSGGFIPIAQLPSYVDDVVEATTFSALPSPGVGSKIYVTTDTNLTYRWSGSVYVEINASVGSADTATRWTTARSIILTGGASGRVLIDGTTDVSLPVTLNLPAFTGDVTTLANGSVTTIANGVVTNAKLANASIAIGTTAIALGGSSSLLAGLTSVTSTAFIGALTGNASTANKWTVARNLTFTGAATGTEVIDGSNDVNITLTLATVTVTSGGTGITSYTPGSYINALNATTLQQRTPAQVLADIGGLASSSYTAADILTKLKTVDGLGSGLDADTLDGLSPANFLRSDTVQVMRTGNNAVPLTLSRTAATSQQISLGLTTTDGTTSYAGYLGIYQGILKFAPTVDLNAGGFNVWHAGNQGASSGLDADLLDGQQGTYYRNASNINSGTLADVHLTSNVPLLNGSATFVGTLAGSNFTGSSSGLNTGDQNLSSYATSASVVAGFAPIKQGIGYAGPVIVDSVLAPTAYIQPWNTSTTNNPNAGSGTTVTFVNVSNTLAMASGTWLSQLEFGTNGQLFWRQSLDGKAWSAHRKIWTDSNQGATSGLDADLLDGQHGAYYQDAGHLNAGKISAGRLPAFTGDVITVAGTAATTIANGVVSFAKMAVIATGSLLGRSTAGVGSPEAITIGSGLSLTNGVLSSAGSGGSPPFAIANGATLASWASGGYINSGPGGATVQIGSTASGGNLLGLMDSTGTSQWTCDHAANVYQNGILYLNGAASTDITRRVPTAPVNDGSLFGVSAGDAAIASAAINFRAAENWTTTAKGSYIQIRAMQPGTVNLIEIARFNYNSVVIAGALTARRTSLAWSLPTFNLPAWGSTGALLNAQPGGVVTDTTTPASTVVGGVTVTSSFFAGTYAAANTAVTYTDSATVYIGNVPTPGTNVTLTNSWALYAVGDIYTTAGLTAGGSVSASGVGGFISSTYVTNARNPIWRFGNSDGYGLSYFQGTAGYGGVSDSLGFHFGTPTAASSVLTIAQAGLTCLGTVTINGGSQVINGSSTNSVYLELNNTVSGGRNYAVCSSGGGPGPLGDFTIWDATANATRLTIDASGTVNIPGSLSAGNISPDAGNNTIVQRNVNGYIFADYFNTTADTTTNTPAAIAVRTGGDNFIRWQTPTQLIDNLGVVKKTGDTISGQLYFTGLEAPPNGISPGSFGRGNADAATFSGNNMAVYSWNGIGFGPSISGQPIANGTYSHYFDCRTGNMGAMGNIAANGTVNGVRLFAGWDSGITGSISCNSWFRSSGQTGFYCSDYGGGIYMTDSTYVRAYNGKAMAASDFVITSDETLKSGIRPLAYKGRLRPINYTLTETGKANIGFSAQEVQKLYPEVVGIIPDTGKLQLSYGKLVAVLSHQVNTVEDVVEEHVGELAKQATTIATLRSEVHELKQQVIQLLQKFQ